MNLQSLLVGISFVLFLGPAVITGLIGPSPDAKTVLDLIALSGAVLGIWASMSVSGWIDGEGIVNQGPEFIERTMRACASDLKQGKLVDGTNLTPEQATERKREIREQIGRLNRARKAGLVSEVHYKNIEQQYLPLCQ